MAVAGSMPTIGAMRMKISAMCLGLATLAGSAVASHAATTPERTAVIRGDYAVLAACTYQALDVPQLAGSLRKVDLVPSHVSKIEANPSGTIYWQLSFHEAAKGRTEIVFRPVRNMWGSDAGGYAELVWPAIEACIAP